MAGLNTNPYVTSPFGDVLDATLAVLPKTYTETLRLTDYPLTRAFFESAKRKPGGKGYEKRVRIRNRGGFRFVNAYETTSTSQEDLIAILKTPWCHWEQKMSFDEKEEAINSGESEQIIDLMQMRRADAYESIYNGIEEACISVPQNDNDDKPFFGLPYLLPPLADNEEDADGGFNVTAYTKGDGTGDSNTIQGIDRSDIANERGRTYGATYSGNADEPFFDTLRRALKRTSFRAIPNLAGDKFPQMNPNFIFVNEDMDDQLDKRINKGPDDKQGDFERFTTPQFRGANFHRVPMMNALSYNPVWGVRTSKLYGIVLKGRWMAEKKALNSQAGIETWVKAVVGSCNLTNDDPRTSGFCIHTVR